MLPDRPMAAVKSVSDEELLRQFDATDDPVLSSVEIAERVDLTQSAVSYRLNEFAERGVVEKKKVGARAVVWWLSDRQGASENERE